MRDHSTIKTYQSHKQGKTVFLKSMPTMRTNSIWSKVWAWLIAPAFNTK